MNTSVIPTKHRARNFLALGLAALVAATVMPAQSAGASGSGDAQSEIAALRAKIAELEGQLAGQKQQQAAAPAAPSASGAASAATVALPTAGTNANGTVTLSPFQVNTTQENGYLRTNAVTATRIGMEIQKVPMTVDVFSSDFIQDANMSTFTDLFRYTSSASGDARFNISRPSNDATPQGIMTLRGFPVNIILRNGVRLYSTKNNFDNVDRVEIVKGPAAVFFGQGYPGGVVNYITKQPQFTKNFTTFRYTFGDNKLNHLIMDTNQVLSDQAAMRIVTGWENSKGQSDFEYTKRFDLTGNITLVPFKDKDLLRITPEVSYLHERYNANDNYSWIFPSGWFQAYANPSAALMTAAGMDPNDPASIGKYKARIWNSLGNYNNDRRKALNDPTLPLYTTDSYGGYYTDTKGNRIHNKSFNFTNRGAYVDNEQTTTDVTVESRLTDWLNIRYVLTHDNTTFNNREGSIYPNADGYTFNSISGGNGAGYYRKTTDHQIDVVVTLPEVLGVKNKVLVGYLFDKYLQQYWAPSNNTTPVFNQVPGFNYPAVNTGPGSLPNDGLNTGWNVPVGQYLVDRFGNIMTAQQVYYNWDPSVQVQPPVDKVFPVNRNLLDAYPNQYNDWYVNWQGSAFEDRLTMLGGFRQETGRGSGQALTANFPWFSPPPHAYADQTTYPPGMYNYSPSYAGDPSNFIKQTGNSWMGGASYEVKKGINVYASVSQTFRFNNNTQLGGYDQVGFPNTVQTLLHSPTYGGTATQNGSITYKFRDGTTTIIHSVADAVSAVDKDGANVRAVNEQGINYEIGVKTSLWDNKFVATASLFRLDRTNQLTEDPQHQTDDPLNYAIYQTLDAQGRPSIQRDANDNPVLVNGQVVPITANTGRVFRWRTNEAHNRIMGMEIGGTWSPTRNFQSVTNFSWLWEAKTIADPSMTTTNINHDIYFGNRIENVPEFSFSSWNRYVLTDTVLRGLSVAVGFEYKSTVNISRSIDWNPNRGGLKADNYKIWNLVVAYPYEILGYKLSSSLGIYNLLDSKYLDGTYVYGPRRNITLSTTLSF